MKKAIDFFKRFFEHLVAWFNDMQAQEAQRIADAQALQQKQVIDNYDRGIIRKQFLPALFRLPDCYNLHSDSARLDSVDANGIFIYRVSKENADKNISITVCNEITDCMNSIFCQLNFDAYEAVNYAHQDAEYSIRTVMTELSARADWNTPEIQGRFNAEFQKAKKAYELSYRKNAPFLVKLQAIAVVEDDNHVLVSIAVMDESEVARWHPDNLPFC